MWKNYELDDTILELNKDMTLYRSDKVLVDLNKGTLAMAVQHEDHKEGLVFIGHGRLVVDTIVETEKGALGKPIDRELSGPFLMLGDIEETLQNLGETSKEDLVRNGVKVEDLLGKAQKLINEFSEGVIHGCDCHNESKKLVFAFATDENRLDVPVLNGSRLVFNSQNMSFMSSGNESILNKAGQLALVTDRESVLVRKPLYRLRARFRKTD